MAATISKSQPRVYTGGGLQIHLKASAVASILLIAFAYFVSNAVWDYFKTEKAEVPEDVKPFIPEQVEVTLVTEDKVGIEFPSGANAQVDKGTGQIVAANGDVWGHYDGYIRHDYSPTFACTFGINVDVLHVVFDEREGGVLPSGISPLVNGHEYPTLYYVGYMNGFPTWGIVFPLDAVTGSMQVTVNGLQCQPESDIRELMEE